MNRIESGRIAELKVLRQEGSRWVLDGDEFEILMNATETDETIEEGQTISVLIYTNRRGELSATMKMPTMTLDTYGWARVIRVDPYEGVYVDIGAPVEVLVNRNDFPRMRELWPQPGDELFMTLRTDRGGTLFGRLITEERVFDQIVGAPTSVYNANLKARAYRLLPVGSFFISVPEKYRVFVHESERKEEPRLGEEVTVRIIGVRDDGTLNGSLLPRKEERLSDDAESILRYMNEIGGRMPFTDKSSPEEIAEMFDMSKASFKRALGRLMKDGKVVQEDGWTVAVK